MEKFIQKATEKFTSVKHPNITVGDIVEVSTIIKEKGKERIQAFRGIVIAIRGSGTGKMFTVRKISYGIGVEKIFPFYSPAVSKIKIIKEGKVKRSKLYYLRQRVGKKALKAGNLVPVERDYYETGEEEKEA